jgi:hypothetical protein
MQKRILASVFLALLFSQAYAEERPDDKGVWTLSYENDTFTGTDSNYTNGVRVAYSSPETKIPEWIENTADKMPLFDSSGHKRWEAYIGQSMFTPRDLTIKTLQPNDRPYAGWLYGTFGVLSDTGRRLDNLQLTLGVVGPMSHAEQVQDIVHRAIGVQIPQGWDNQLHNEPGVVLTYQRSFERSLSWKSPCGLGADMTPSFGGNLGNVYTNANIGSMFRFGTDLEADYGPPIITPNLTGSDFFRPNKDFTWYVFTGAQAKAVARNIFLDGNTLGSSHSVDKYPLVGELQVGVVFTFLREVRVGFTQTFNTKEFVGQPQYNNFSAVTLSWRY